MTFIHYLGDARLMLARLGQQATADNPFRVRFGRKEHGWFALFLFNAAEDECHTATYLLWGQTEEKAREEMRLLVQAAREICPYLEEVGR